MSAPKLFTGSHDEKSGAPFLADARPATPADAIAFLSETPEGRAAILSQAAEQLYSHADKLPTANWDEYDDAAAICQRLARIEREAKERGNG